MQFAASELREEEEEEVFPEAPKIVTPPPGPRSRALLEAQKKYETKAVVYPGSFPIAIDTARGSTIRDADGNYYIDWVSGISVLNLGHGNPKIVQAVRAQEDRVWHTLEIPTETRVNFLKTLNGVLPGDLRENSKVLFTVTGGDAAEAAVSLARWVTGKRTIVGFEGAYHGVAQGLVSMTASAHYKDYAGVPDYGVQRFPFPYSYRPVVDGKSPEEYAQFILDYLEHSISDPYSGLSSLAGILAEPIQGEGGYIVPPPNFLPGLREIATKHSVPLIVDEIQSGLGRAGRMWACELTGTSPDIVLISKSIGGGIPLSMIAYRQEYDEKLEPAFHLGTYRGNVLGLAAGTEVLKLLQLRRLPERAASLGEKLMERLSEDASRSHNMGEVRGSGFMIGIEMVEDLKSKSPATDYAKRSRIELLKKGLLMHTCGHYGNVFRYMAPLTISESLIEKGLEIFEQTVPA
jgi:4-aminobutyrate aminotransferase-like enzyme